MAVDWRLQQKTGQCSRDVLSSVVVGNKPAIEPGTPEHLGGFESQHGGDEGIEMAQQDATLAGQQYCAKVQSQLSKRPEISPYDEPPDGGLNAWLKVLGCFLLYSNIWGFTITFGAFQSYYEHFLLSSSSPSAISWVGTVQSWLLILVGVLSGPLFDLGYYHSMLIVGNGGVIVGIFALSWCKTYWQVFFAQGVCMGLGAGLLYVPSLALVGLSFKRKRALAQGIVTSGIAAGGVAYIISFNRITTERSFGWAVRVMGFIAMGIAILALPALLWGTSALSKSRTRRRLIDGAAWKNPPFLIFTACNLSIFFGYVVPYFYIPSFAQNTLGIDKMTSLNILVMTIGASFFGRLSAGIIAHMVGPVFTWCCCAAVSGLLSLTWIAVTSRSGLIAFAILWGFCSAGLVTLPAAVFPSLCPDPRRLGTWTGMSWGISSFASLTGSPIAGALIGKTRNAVTGKQPRSDFLGPQLWCGCCLLLGAAITALLGAVIARRRKSGLNV